MMLRHPTHQPPRIVQVSRLYKVLHMLPEHGVQFHDFTDAGQDLVCIRLHRGVTALVPGRVDVVHLHLQGRAIRHYVCDPDAAVAHQQQLRNKRACKMWETSHPRIQ